MERKNTQLIKAFATVLKERRRAAGLSQEELAFRTELSMSYISLLETQNRQPTLTVLAAICQQLGVSIADFMAEIESL
ncbi:helix-turn-helix domain-containing protein [Roseovarius sp. EL26]|uniref:helix-turn-helix domain-containing protein n=1 Tax=Roseovarius sp. EL26 TaxID=2126672 RepID=UPI000EA0901B|nr:helix-turn-helix transcriptional regulator [Roseovarius sp. EL26]